MDVQLFRDRLCAVTPNGRPRNKPRRLVTHFSLLNSTETKETKHRIGFSECISSRPPLYAELLATPTPCTYTIPSSSSRNTGTVKYRNNYFNKIDTSRAPTPCTYNIPKTIGCRLQVMKSYPSYTIGKQERPSLTRKGSELGPGPCSYEVTEKPSRIVIKTHPPIIINRALNVDRFHNGPNFLLIGFTICPKSNKTGF